MRELVGRPVQTKTISLNFFVVLFFQFLYVLSLTNTITQPHTHYQRPSLCSFKEFFLSMWFVRCLILVYCCRVPTVIKMWLVKQNDALSIISSNPRLSIPIWGSLFVFWFVLLSAILITLSFVVLCCVVQRDRVQISDEIRWRRRVQYNAVTLRKTRQHSWRKNSYFALSRLFQWSKTDFKISGMRFVSLFWQRDWEWKYNKNKERNWIVKKSLNVLIAFYFQGLRSEEW